jgi:hypothetical protein
MTQKDNATAVAPVDRLSVLGEVRFDYQTARKMANGGSVALSVIASPVFSSVLY